MSRSRLPEAREVSSAVVQECSVAERWAWARGTPVAATRRCGRALRLIPQMGPADCNSKPVATVVAARPAEAQSAAEEPMGETVAQEQEPPHPVATILR